MSHPTKLHIHLSHGSSDVIFNINEMFDRFAREVVNQDRNSIWKPDYDIEPKALTLEDYTSLPVSAYAKRHDFELRKLSSMQSMVTDKLKGFLTAKPVEFSIPILTMQNIEDLAVKYMYDFGGSSSTILLTKINTYLNLISIIDNEDAFRIFHNQERTRGALIELNPNKYAVGHYDSHMELLLNINSKAGWSR